MAFLTVDPFLLPRGLDPDLCLLARAGDDGMNPDGIRKGDLLVIEEADPSALRNGELAAFLVGEDLRARRFDFANGKYHLRPADRKYTDETFLPGDPGCHVVGRVVAVMRKLS